MKSTTFKHTLSVLALGLMGLAAGGVQAGWDHDHDHDYRHGQDFQQSQSFGQAINARQDKQMQRIQAGFRNGALTQYEYRELMGQQANIREMERRFRFDNGRIDAWEFKRLDRALDAAGHNIRDEKTDRQARNSYNYHPWYN
jgi:hypothetical protein